MNFEAKKAEVLTTCLALADEGYLAGTGGNVALRVDDDHFAVTPSASDYYTMSPSDICIVRLSDGAQVEGSKPPSVESSLHAGVLQARPECAASIHTHQPVASAYALLAKPLHIEDTARQEFLGNNVPCVGYAPSGTPVLAWRVRRAFKRRIWACLMRNHGVVCIGKDADEAIRRIAELESAATAYFLAAATDNTSCVPGDVRGFVADALTPIAKNTTQETRL